MQNIISSYQLRVHIVRIKLNTNDHFHSSASIRGQYIPFFSLSVYLPLSLALLCSRLYYDISCYTSTYRSIHLALYQTIFVCIFKYPCINVSTNSFIYLFLLSIYLYTCSWTYISYAYKIAHSFLTSPVIVISALLWSYQSPLHRVSPINLGRVT